MRESRLVGMVAAMLLLGGCDDKPNIAQEPTVKDGLPATACAEGLPGPKMVHIVTDSGKRFCIDERKVTRREYQEFVDDKSSDASGELEACKDNVVEPRVQPLAGGDLFACPAWTDPDRRDHGVYCVDFCDAHAYCAWAGKRLCGEIGKGAVAATPVPEAQATMNAGSKSAEWYYVCSQGGQTAFPYGNTYEPGRCVDGTRVAAEGYQSARALRTDEQENCKGTKPPFDAVFHMSSTSNEWVGFQVDPEQAVVQGGGSTPDCTPGVKAQVSIGANLSFRCCADAVPAAETKDAGK